MTKLLIVTVVLFSQVAVAAVDKKPKKINLGLVQKAPAPEVQFKPETDPNRRSIEQERYTNLDKLEWQSQGVLNQQQAVTDAHGQYQQKQVFNQAMQNLPRISVPTFR